MKVIRGVNVNEVFQIAVMNLRESSQLLETDSRNGPVLSFPTPLMNGLMSAFYLALNATVTRSSILLKGCG